MKQTISKQKTALETVDPSQMRGQFTFYRSYYDAIRALSKRRQLAIYDAICGYALYGVEPEGLDPVQWASFVSTRPSLDRARRKALSILHQKPAKPASSPKNSAKEPDGSGVEVSGSGAEASDSGEETDGFDAEASSSGEKRSNSDKISSKINDLCLDLVQKYDKESEKIPHPWEKRPDLFPQWKDG